MYTNFRVQNFRCFEDLELTDLARINLIGGKNNVGKTSLLEAIFLHSGDIPFRRLIVERQAGQMKLMEWQNLFAKFDISQLITTTANTHQGKLRVKSLDEFLSDFIHEDDTQKNRLGVIYNAAIQNGAHEILILNHNASTRYFYLNSEKMVHLGASDNFLTNTHYVHSGCYDRSTKNTREMWGRIVLEGQRQKFIAVLQTLDIRIQHLEILADFLYVTIDGIDQPVPIQSVGVGFSSLLDIMFSLFEYSGGIVLIDEIENGLHHSVLVDVWKAIHHAAEEFNVQIFATTHSDEMIQAANEAFRETPEAFRYHRLDRKNNGQIKAVNYPPDVFNHAIEGNFEVRG